MGKYKGKIVGFPGDLLSIITKKYPINNFLETGTNLGDTAEWACNKFNVVYTCEPSGHFYNLALKRLNKYKNCNLYNLDSLSFFNSIMESLLGNSIFWLDSHYNVDELSYGKSVENPLIKEVEYISKLNGDKYIVIDDFRQMLFPDEPTYVHGWPPLYKIINALNLLSDNFVMAVPDCLISLPNKCIPIIRKYRKRIRRFE